MLYDNKNLKDLKLEEKLQAYLEKIDKVNENGYYRTDDNWASMLNYPVPQWYKDGKFGIFMHWGIYSVPAFQGEWYPHWLYKEDSKELDNAIYNHHIETYGSIEAMGYKDFIPSFTAEKFDPAHWASLFKKAGAKFVMPVAEHHDGFAMYDTCLSPWNSANMGPCKDILAELKPAIEAEGMEFTASSHRIEHSWFTGGSTRFYGEPEYGDMFWPSITKSKPERNDLYCEITEKFMQDWLVRTCEIVDKYRPKIMYFDWWIEMEDLQPYFKKFAAYYYNRAREWGIDVAINYKMDAMAHTTGVLDLERKQMESIYPFFWQCDTSLYVQGWCYTTNAIRKQPQEIIHDLVDIVSKNGALLLNIGPKADGTFDQRDEKLLMDIGEWLEVNGDGIYGTIPWKYFGEGPTKISADIKSDQQVKEYTSEDFRITYKNNTVYLFAMKTADNNNYKVKCLNGKFGAADGLRRAIKNIEVLGYGDCEYNQTDEYLELTTKDIDTAFPICFKITIK